MKAIVTGGCGFIGSHLVERLMKESWNVKILDNLSRGKSEHGYAPISNVDLTDSRACHQEIRDVDVVFHLANVVSGITWHKDHPADLCANFAINYNVIQACAHNKIPKTLYVSSSCVYPAFIQTPTCAPYLPENSATELGAMPSGVYGWTKLTGEIMLRAHMDQYKMKAACIRPFNVYGAREDFSVDRGHVIPSLIRRGLNREDPFMVWGSGEQDRGFTYIDDIIDGIMLAYEMSDTGDPINLGYPEKVKIKDLAKKVVALAEYNPIIQFLPNMPEGDFSKGADITRARELLGWEPKVDIDEGLRRTWKWAKQHVRSTLAVAGTTVAQ